MVSASRRTQLGSGGPFKAEDPRDHVWQQLAGRTKAPGARRMNAEVPALAERERRRAAGRAVGRARTAAVAVAMAAWHGRRVFEKGRAVLLGIACDGADAGGYPGMSIVRQAVRAGNGRKSQKDHQHQRQN
ncbi:hypothetical protein HYPGJ_31599 [Hyphomicrobium sp. GJ21]|nr:hypothetical protein HYPGJ_31599 [Hyphomicrobium sp. GJ21]